MLELHLGTSAPAWELQSSMLLQPGSKITTPDSINCLRHQLIVAKRHLRSVAWLRARRTGCHMPGHTHPTIASPNMQFCNVHV